MSEKELEQIDPSTVGFDAVDEQPTEEPTTPPTEDTPTEDTPKTDIDETKSKLTQISTTAPTYAKIVKALKTPKTDKVLDYGCGRGVGADLLREMGYTVDTFECYPQDGFNPTFTEPSSIPNNAYDLIIINYVVNVVPQETRDEVITNAYDKLAVGGKMMVTSMNYAYINSLKKKEGNIELDDGAVLTTRGTYQKGWTPSELSSYIVGLTSGEVVDVSGGIGMVRCCVTKPTK